MPTLFSLIDCFLLVFLILVFQERVWWILFIYFSLWYFILPIVGFLLFRNRYCRRRYHFFLSCWLRWKYLLLNLLLFWLVVSRQSFFIRSFSSNFIGLAEKKLFLYNSSFFIFFLFFYRHFFILDFRQASFLLSGVNKLGTLYLLLFLHFMQLDFSTILWICSILEISDIRSFHFFLGIYQLLLIFLVAAKGQSRPIIVLK